MVSFDVMSLFTNVPLKKTIKICLDRLYRGDPNHRPSIPESTLKKLLELCVCTFNSIAICGYCYHRYLLNLLFFNLFKVRTCKFLLVQHKFSNDLAQFKKLNPCRFCNRFQPNPDINSNTKL